MKKIRYAVLFLLGIFVLGVSGYIIIEGWSFLDSAYMVIVTISTVGFKEVRELSPSGQMFTIFLILLGLGGITTAARVLAASFFEEHFQEQYRRKKMEKELENIKSHYIIIGLGDLGREVASVLLKSNAKFIIIDENEEVLQKFCEENAGNGTCLYIAGNGMDENILKKARIDRAVGAVIALGTDADALLTVITIRELNSDIRIISRANDEKTKNKFLKAGADSVIAPNFIIGNRIANTLLKPHLISFLDSVTNVGKTNIVLEEIKIPEGSRLIGKALKELQIPAKTGFIVFAIKRKYEVIQFNPGPADSLEGNDSILAVGNYDNINKLLDYINSFSS